MNIHEFKHTRFIGFILKKRKKQKSDEKCVKIFLAVTKNEKKEKFKVDTRKIVIGRSRKETER